MERRELNNREAEQAVGGFNVNPTQLEIGKWYMKDSLLPNPILAGGETKVELYRCVGIVSAKEGEFELYFKIYRSEGPELKYIHNGNYLTYDFVEVAAPYEWSENGNR